MEPSSSTDPLKVFYDSLTKEIDDLESMLQTDNNNFMSIQFLERVLSLTRSCHNQATNLALTLKLPAGGSWSQDYVVARKQFLKDSKDIKEGVQRMANYYNNGLTLTSFLDANRVFTAQACQEVITAITDRIIEGDELETDNNPLSRNWRDLGLTEGVGSETVLHENFGFNGVIYATRKVCNSLLRILVYGLVYCWPEYKFESYVYKGAQLIDSSFMVSTDRLQQRVVSEINKLTRQSGILCYEFRRSKVALDELRGVFEMKCLQGVELHSEDGINEKVENLKRYFEVLKEGSESIIMQIDDFPSDDIFEARKVTCFADRGKLHKRIYGLNNIDSLPTDILLEEILPRIDAKRDRDSLSLVSKRWFELEGKTRKSIKISARMLSEKTIEMIGWRFPFTRNVKIDGSLALSEYALQCQTRHGCFFDMDKLSALGRVWPEMVELDLSHWSGFYQKGFIILMSTCGSSLKMIRLSNCDGGRLGCCDGSKLVYGLTNECLVSIGKFGNKLTDLTIESDAISDRGLVPIAKGCPLQNVHLKCSKASTISLEAITLYCSSSIENLSLRCCKRMDKGFYDVGRLCKGLKVFVLKDTLLVTDVEVINVFYGCQELTLIKLIRCHVLTFVALFGIITYCSRLRSLELQGFNGQGIQVPETGNCCTLLENLVIRSCNNLDDFISGLIRRSTKHCEVNVIDSDDDYWTDEDQD